MNAKHNYVETDNCPTEGGNCGSGDTLGGGLSLLSLSASAALENLQMFRTTIKKNRLVDLFNQKGTCHVHKKKKIIQRHLQLLAFHIFSGVFPQPLVALQVIF